MNETDHFHPFSGMKKLYEDRLVTSVTPLDPAGDRCQWCAMPWGTDSAYAGLSKATTSRLYLICAACLADNPDHGAVVA